jgi:hypothetical protein
MHDGPALGIQVGRKISQVTIDDGISGFEGG